MLYLPVHGQVKEAAREISYVIINQLKAIISVWIQNQQFTLLEVLTVTAP